MGTIITQIGLEKIANATANEPLRLEKFAVGDGNGEKITPNSDMTSLVNEKYRDLISSKYTNGNNTVFENVLKATAQIDEGFYIRELGLFDEAGDLIVIMDVPAQYRPATNVDNFITELLFNVTIQVHDSNVIEIKINEQLFATLDSAQRLLNRVEILENNSKKLIESSVGIERWFNTDNKYKDCYLIKVGIKMYALMDESNILKIADYPLLFKNINGVDRGDGTFSMPKFQDGTIRHLPIGTTRVLGSFEEDEIKSHTHGMENDHDMAHHHKISEAAWRNKPNIEPELLWRWEQVWSGLLGWRRVKRYYFGPLVTLKEFWEGLKDLNIFSSRDRTGTSSKTVTNNTGSTETRMKNTGGQWYLLAKIDM